MTSEPPSSAPERRVSPDAVSKLLEELAHLPTHLTEGEEPIDTWRGSLQRGTLIGRFELVREIGRGGCGVVWEARDRELGRSVAVKYVRAGGALHLREERLLREAEAAAQLSHPNIVTLHDVGRCEHGPYLVLELLQGCTLADRLERGGRMPLPEVLRIGCEVAQGVAHAHAHGVIHRDLKPANVFLCDDGRVKVLDFGLAHALGRQRAGGGTPAYMAPEQRRGRPEDERTDVFAMGVMLHQALSWRRSDPHREDQFKWAWPSGELPSLRSPARAWPALSALVSRMLATEATRRPRDGQAVLDALSALRAQFERGHAETSPARAPPWRPRRALVVGCAALATALVAIAAASRRAPSPRPSPAGSAPSQAAQRAQVSRLPEAADPDALMVERADAHAIAYAHYTRGLQAVAEAMEFALARKEFQQALTFDGAFAEPRFQLSLLGDDPEAFASRSAPGWRDRLTEEERQVLRAESTRGEAARRLYQELLIRYPEDKQIAWLAGQSASAQGDLWGAVESYRRALMADPAYLPALDAFFRAWPALDLWARQDELEGIGERAVAARPDPGTYTYRAWAYALRGEREEAIATARRALQGHRPPSPFVSRKLASLLLDLGEQASGEALLRPWTRQAVEATTRAPAFWALGRALAAQGRLHALRALAVTVRGSRDLEHARALAEALEGAAAYVAGAPERARGAWQRALEAGAPLELSVHPALLASLGDLRSAQSVCRPAAPPLDRFCAAMTAWKRGDRTGALAALQELHARYDDPLADLLAGELHAELGQDAAAVAALKRFLRTHDGLSFERLGARWRLAHLQAHLGQRRRALQSTRQLLSELRRADGDLPLLQAARALEQRLRLEE